MKILIGITGGIAIVKIPLLISALRKEGHEVKCLMTENAAKFISPHLVFLPLSNNPVYVDMWAPPQSFMVEHIELAKWPDLALLAPATANTIGKLVNSIADNLLTTVLLAIPSSTPIFIAPAMNTEMWKNPFFQEAFHKLQKLPNYHILPPIEKRLACGDIGIGAMAEVDTILETLGQYWRALPKSA